VEEEANAQKYIDKMKYAGSNNAAVLFIDTELAGRTYAPLSPNGGK